MAQAFVREFEALAWYKPFPWQVKLYRRFVGDEEGGIPATVVIPTGLGKTSVIAIWLLALIKQPDKLPRRLVYVVNRRTVVDQSTAEVIKYRRAVAMLSAENPLRATVERLGISTLRGQFADNQEWSADPSRPAVICGTVDLIGSRLLFSGYRIGFKSRPLHAGFLGQDALLVHDEAHLEPAFQRLVADIENEQKRERKRAIVPPWPQLHVMELSATARNHDDVAQQNSHKPFDLSDEEKQPPEVIPDPPTEPVHHVWRRCKATKSLLLHPCEVEGDLVEQIADLAAKHQGNEAAVLIFVRRVEDVSKVIEGLKKKGVPDDHIEALTGTMRGYERDRLVDPRRHDASCVFARFLLPPKSDAPEGERWQIEPMPGTVYLVCTSAGEVGVNLSADHMVCDLSTFDSMAQRLGRVNRFGDRNDTRVDVVHPQSFDDAKPNPQRQATLHLLKQLNGDASPKALGDLPADQRRNAFSPEPTILPATDILFDAWAMTTIKNMMPGRPPVGPYLHGVAEWEPPRTSVAWRKEVNVIAAELIELYGAGFPRALLDDYPLKPHELLSDTSERVYKSLESVGKRLGHKDCPVWLVGERNEIEYAMLRELLAGEKKWVVERIAERILLLPPWAGSLSRQGTLAGDRGYDEEIAADPGYDVADRWVDDQDRPRRERFFSDGRQPDGRYGMALIRTIDTNPNADEFELATVENSDESEEGTLANKRRFWHWFARPRDAEDATRASVRPVKLEVHTRDVLKGATEIAEELKFSNELKQAVVLAAELHDLGKKRELWQRSIGNPNPAENWYAKPGKPDAERRWRPRHLSEYRHEFGSLLDAIHDNGELTAKLAGLSDEMRDVVLHLVAAHHGYARPHFPTDAYDHERYNTQQNEEAAHEVMRRYARLQRRYGRWGLAYLESLLRAADWAASAAAGIDAELDGARANVEGSEV